MSTLATKTFRKNLSNGDVLIAKAQIEDLGQHPYFSITGELYDRDRNNGDECVLNANEKRRWLGSCGQLPDEIQTNIPALAPYLRWHLTSTDGPMHYLANAHYHAGFCEGMEDSRNIEYLKSTIVYGALESDNAVSLETLNESQLDAFLVERFPALMLKFQSDMETLFGDRVLNDHLIKMGIETPIRKPRKTDDERKAEARQKVIDHCANKVRQYTTEQDGLLWLIDHGIKTDNVIFYDHRQMFTFGWRDKVKAAERDAILDVISEFPFEYEIKAEDKVYSGRE